MASQEILPQQESILLPHGTTTRGHGAANAKWKAAPTLNGDKTAWSDALKTPPGPRGHGTIHLGRSAPPSPRMTDALDPSSERDVKDYVDNRGSLPVNPTTQGHRGISATRTPSASSETVATPSDTAQGDTSDRSWYDY